MKQKLLAIVSLATFPTPSPLQVMIGMEFNNENFFEHFSRILASILFLTLNSHE
ncbi:MAG: hypothetical protein PHW92_01675 [Lutibacter sp.]|nr:hypothetical protein [Lutibacter sp.]